MRVCVHYALSFIARSRLYTFTEVILLRRRAARDDIQAYLELTRRWTQAFRASSASGNFHADFFSVAGFRENLHYVARILRKGSHNLFSIVDEGSCSARLSLYPSPPRPTFYTL